MAYDESLVFSCLRGLVYHDNQIRMLCKEAKHFFLSLFNDDRLVGVISDDFCILGDNFHNFEGLCMKTAEHEGTFLRILSDEVWFSSDTQP